VNGGPEVRFPLRRQQQDEVAAAPGAPDLIPFPPGPGGAQDGQAGNWEELDRNYELLVQVNQRNLASEEPAVLADIERAGRWKLLAYNKNLLKKKPDRILSNLIEMYEATVKIIEELHGKDDPRLIGPLSNLSLARYHMLDEINSRSLGEFQGTGEKERLQRVCRPVFTRQ